jgi:hypothetical protein
MLDVIIGVIIGARPVRRERVGQSTGVGRGRGETGGSLGKLGRLIRGAQSEWPREKRQSGVVDIDGGLRQGVH